MRWVAGLLLAAGGCGSGPYAPFDAGHDVHVILLATPAPKDGITIAPVTTLGPDAVRSPPRVLDAKDSPAVEVAVFRAPAGRHRLAVWEPGTRMAASRDIEVEAEVWVVVEMRPPEREGRLRLFDVPPAGEIGPYVPLVPVPD